MSSRQSIFALALVLLSAPTNALAYDWPSEEVAEDSCTWYIEQVADVQVVSVHCSLGQPGGVLKDMAYCNALTYSDETWIEQFSVTCLKDRDTKFRCRVTSRLPLPIFLPW